MNYSISDDYSATSRRSAWAKVLWLMALLFVFTACGAKDAPTSSSVTEASSGGNESGNDASTVSVNTQGPWKVGIAQLAQHPSLDKATQGFEDALKKELGDKVSFDVQNASGETAMVSTIINGFVAQNVDLILANATAPLQSAAAATATIPVLGTSVTDYASALELTNFEGTVGTNVSGTTDLAPFAQQVEIFQDLFPGKHSVGILYSSSEANSVFQVKNMTELLVQAGYDVKDYSFTDSNDLQAVVQKAVAEADILYMPTDNVAASNAEAIANIVLPAKKPMIAAEEQSAKVLGVASIAVDYYKLGELTGQMAAKVLRGEESISQMPIASAKEIKKKINEKNAKVLGVKIPQDYDVIEGTADSSK